MLRVRSAALTSAPDLEAERVVAWAPRQNLTPGPLNPFEENSVRGTSADLWGYRRVSIDWPLVDPLLPSPRAGLIAWLEAADCDR
jgi:hypothetical protein